MGRRSWVPESYRPPCTLVDTSFHPGKTDSDLYIAYAVMGVKSDRSELCASSSANCREQKTAAR
jgi:hypothetical protein